MVGHLRHKPAVVLITGASRGLGRALTLELASRGLAVAALGRNLPDLEAVSQEANGGQVLPVVADVSDPQQLRQAFEHIDTALGPVDTLINNAAVYQRRDFLKETPESFQQTMAVNLGGMLTCSMLALERMTQAGTGRIVNVTTFADVKPAHLSSAYSVSKGGCRILTRAMVKDITDRFPNIVINEWIPGILRTEMGLETGHDPAKVARWGATLALWRDPDLSGVVFAEDREHRAPQSFKHWLWNKVSGQSPKARRLG